MIRVLHVIPRLFPGGEQTLIMEWYRKIDKSIIQFDFVVCHKEKGIFEDEVISLGGKIFHSPRFNGVNFFQYVKWWRSFLKEHKEYRVIHGHLRSTATIYLYIAKKNGLFTIAHSHNTTNGYSFLAPLKDILQIPLKHIADYMFACSAQAAEYLYGKGIFSKPNFRLLENAIDCDRFKFNIQKREEIRKELNAQDKFIIGQVGRFVKQKNHEFTINLFEKYHQINPNSLLLLIGDGELKDSIQSLCIEKGIEDDVVFAGVKKNVEDYYQAMDAFLMPSLNEGLGIVAIEAQASGLPVLCSSTLPKEIKCTESCYYLPLRQPDSWIQTLTNLKVCDRSHCHEIISDSNYNMNHEIIFLKNFYCKVYKTTCRDDN